MKLTKADYRPEPDLDDRFYCEECHGDSAAIWTILKDEEFDAIEAAQRLGIARGDLDVWLCQACYDALPAGEDGAA